MRTPPNITKREVFGIPGQPLLVYAADHLSENVADAIFRCAQWTTFGDLSRYGIPRAPIGAYAGHRLHGRNPAVDDGFVDALKRGAAQVVGPVDRLAGDAVMLLDGRCIRPDAVICATGTDEDWNPWWVIWACWTATECPSITAGLPSIRGRRVCTSAACTRRSRQIRLGAIHARRIARAAAVDRRMRYRVHAGL